MNSTDIVPANLADDSVCSYCYNEISTENELLNKVCFVCQDNERTEPKLNAFDDLIAAVRHVLYLSEQISDDISPDFRLAWDKATNSLCRTLRATYSI